jgi:Tfp pilus assembly protein PilF
MPQMTLEQALELAAQQFQTGSLLEAQSLLRQILAQKPDHPDALHLLGLIAHRLGHHGPAIDLLQRALLALPQAADIHANLGAVLATIGQFEQAIEQYRQALALDPNHADAHNNLGTALGRTGRRAEAEAEFRRALELRPQFPEAINNLGIAIRDQGRPQEALPYFHQAIALRPNYAEAYNNLGATVERFGGQEEVVAAYRKALALRPDYPEAQFNLGLSLLLQGDFAHGWPLYDARRGMMDSSVRRDFAQPLWDGSPLEGRRILLHAEQGHGDTIQFARYVPMVTARGGETIVQCQPALVRLLRAQGIFGQVVAQGEPEPPFDLQCPLMSLAGVFGTTLDSIPRSNPYIRADRQLVDQWRQRLAPFEGKLKIGIAWAGNATHIFDRDRSLPIAAFAPLAEVDCAQFFSLQKGPAAEQCKSAPERMNLVDFSDLLGDFADTAALIENLDLVLAVDTAIVHLAGAMGRPAWVLLPFAPDWRWMLNRADSAWYPTLRLFRQMSRGDWQPAIAQITEELRRWPR